MEGDTSGLTVVIQYTGDTQGKPWTVLTGDGQERTYASEVEVHAFLGHYYAEKRHELSVQQLIGNIKRHAG